MYSMLGQRGKRCPYSCSGYLCMQWTQNEKLVQFCTGKTTQVCWFVNL